MPAVYDEFQRIGQQLEQHYRNVQDLEFTIERGRLYMLQTRDAKRTAAAAVKIAVDMVDEGMITQGGGGRPDRAGPGRPAPARHLRPGRAQGREADRQRASTPRPAPPSAGRCSTPTTPSSGSTAARRSSSSGSRPRPTTSTAWPCAEGIITARGGATSHAAVVARQIGKPCVAGSADLDRRLRRQAGATATSPGIDFKEGDWVSLDGTTGDAVPRARCRPVEARFEDQPELQTDPRLGRRDPPDGRLDQRRQARGGRPGPRLRRPGHRPVPHRAHVPRGRPARDRARRDPRRQRGDAGQGEAWPPATR